MPRGKLYRLKKYEAEVKITRARAAAAAAAITDPDDNPEHDIPELDNAGDKTKNGRKRVMNGDNEGGPSRKKTVEEEKNEPEGLGLTDFEDSEELMGNAGMEFEMTEGENNISLTDDEMALGRNSPIQGRV